MPAVARVTHYVSCVCSGLGDRWVKTDKNESTSTGEWRYGLIPSAATDLMALVLLQHSVLIHYVHHRRGKQLDRVQRELRARLFAVYAGDTASLFDTVPAINTAVHEALPQLPV